MIVVKWLSEYDWLSDNDNIVLKLEKLTSGTALMGSSPAALAEKSLQSIDKIKTIWKTVEAGILEELEQVSKSDIGVVKKAVENKLSHHHSLNLLIYLASKSFLPVYGFPTDVVEFRNKRKGEKSLGSKEKFPSRNMVTALREYAPGNSVVINGVVYKSRGLAVNWKRPTDGDSEKKPPSFQMVLALQSCPE